MLIGRKDRVDSRTLMDGLADGKKPRTIAAEVGCTYPTLRKRLVRHVHENGFKTVEQAVAHHVADKIKRCMPLALQNQVDLVMRRKKP